MPAPMSPRSTRFAFMLLLRAVVAVLSPQRMNEREREREREQALLWVFVLSCNLPTKLIILGYNLDTNEVYLNTKLITVL